MDKPRILTEAETETRRNERASGTGHQTITVCAEPRCPDIAKWGPYCAWHSPAAPNVVVAHELTDTEISTIRADVEAKAAPLFLLAMDFILRAQLAQLGVELAAPVVAIARPDSQPA